MCLRFVASVQPRVHSPFVVCTINVFRLQRKFMTSPSRAINKDAFTRRLCQREPPTSQRQRVRNVLATLITRRLQSITLSAVYLITSPPLSRMNTVQSLHHAKLRRFISFAVCPNLNPFQRGTWQQCSQFLSPGDSHTTCVPRHFACFYVDAALSHNGKLRCSPK